MTIWELVVCGILILTGFILSYSFYKYLVWDVELSKAFKALDEDTIEVAYILNKEKERKGE